jgi:hypothetical protein
MANRAGIPAFFTATAVGTKLAAGKEQREIGLSIFGAEFQSGHGEMQTDDARRNGGASRARYSGRLVR